MNPSSEDEKSLSCYKNNARKAHLLRGAIMTSARPIGGWSQGR